MSQPIPFDRDGDIIDVGRSRPRRRRWKWLILVLVIILFVVASRALSIYLAALWFGSLGYSSVFWRIFRLKLELFLVFLIITAAILRVAFWLIERAFADFSSTRRTVFINQQPVNFSPLRILRPLAWIVSIIAGVVFAFGMRESWRSFALYFHQAATAETDPIFNKPVSFYLFTLPIYDAISQWALLLSFIVLIATLIYTGLALTEQRISTSGDVRKARMTSLTAVSIAITPLLIILAWRFLLSRYEYLWSDHEIFSGVNYVEANHLLPAFSWTAIAIVIAALICLINAFVMRKFRIMIGALAIPLVVYLVGTVLIPAYVTSFIVKPNELVRETPYIDQNIAWTRKAYGIDRIEQRSFDVAASAAAFDLQSNRPTLDNIRLWDWRALKDTLTQIQAIRTYYDFTDVDVDRYSIGGERRQMMLGTRELNVDKLPESSRNWVNEKLIYTHGYGLTMNTANGFDSEGMPKFILSNMPVESTAPDIKVNQAEIYFGQETDHNVYVKTKRLEFNYPQGETNNVTTYDGTGGIRIGSFFRRWLLAWALDDLTKLPFSDDVTSDSRVLINRNIRQIVDGVAPFLIYDNDPYMVVSADGRLFWIIDAFTETANYPYSRHYQAADKTVNYIRNSVKVVIDAYNGTTNFYVFDAQDPLIQTYRSVFPSLFRDAKEMPADLRAHVRYPETLIKTQAEVYGLYHTQDANSFFQREDLWNVARQVGLSDDKQQQQEQPIEPYFVMMQLPGENKAIEFVEILPFTPSNRNNMIGWIAGRCDGDAYGSLIAYNFPKSRLIDGPLQIEARIDQNAQLSGQFTLWNQQGSHVQRGHLLVIPIGQSILYVEPVYLKAERSPMPELRLVVLATQDRLAYGANFEEALTNLFGEAAKAPPTQNPSQSEQQKPTGLAQPSPSPSPVTAANTQQLIEQATQEFDEYQRLTSEGKLGEAGRKLEELRRTLDELKRASSRRPQ